MNEKNKNIKCIYCLEEKSSSKEHVIPYTLGGNLTIPCVCKECNNSMSPLDQSLCDSSLITLTRITEQPHATITNNVSYGTKDVSFSSEIRLGYLLQPEIKAQLHFEKINDKSYTIHGSAKDQDHYQELINIIKSYIIKNKLKSIPTLSNQLKNERLPFPRIFLHKGKQLAFRASFECNDIEKEKNDLIDLITKKIVELEIAIISESKKITYSVIEKPEIIINFSADFGKNHRAVTKIAFNFAALIFGPEPLYSEEFNDLRAFIKSGEKANEPGHIWYGGQDYDLGMTRFSVWEKDFSKNPLSFSKRGVHTITLTTVSKRITAVITFYAKDTFIVDLGSIEYFPSILLPITYEFDFIARTNKQLSVLQMIQRYQDKII